MKTLKSSLLLTLCSLACLTPASQAKTKKPSMAAPIRLVGIVAGAPDGPEFLLRANGQTFRVRPLPEVDLKSVHGGDQVRVWGRPTGLRVNYANVKVLQTAASSNPTDYNPAPGTSIESQPHSGG